MKRYSALYFDGIKRFALYIVATLLLPPFFSCNTTKKLHKGEYLLNSDKIIYDLGSISKTKGLNSITNLGKEGIEQFEISRQIAPSEILPYIKQKPNTRILFVFPFYLYLYNLPDSVNTEKAKARRDSTYVIKARRKKWTDEKLKRKMARKTGREWIMSQGESPVILDSSLTSKSTEQIKTFLMNKGYFNARVKDSTHLYGKKADVSYIIKPVKPYRIRRVDYYFEDPGLISEIYTDTANCMIRRNEIYDNDNFDAERDRLTKQLNNSGYYYFSKSYVSYVCDTDSRNHWVDVSINIKKFAKRDTNYKDSVTETSHPWYRIGHVTIQMEYNPTATIYQGEDTTFYDGLAFVSPQSKLTVKPTILRPKIFVTPGDVYRIKNRDDTYTGLSQLGEFSYVSVKYVPEKDSNFVNCYIQLMPVVKHSVGAEFELTNTGGDGGIQGDVSYENYNQFRGAEKLQFKLNGGLIAQKALFAGGGGVLFNTEDLGPELDLSVPRPWFPFNLFHFARRANPQTTVKLNFDYQLRLNYYERRVLGLSYAFDYDPVKTQHITVALLELSLVNAGLSDAFEDLLQQYNQFFQNSFKNQFITDSRVSWTWNTQLNNGRQTHFSYVRINIENSGFDFSALEHAGLIKLPFESGAFSVFGLPAYSQYIKGDAEGRHYWLLGKKQKIVIRGILGAGLPYENSSELPFTKSFWAGGSNDIRAWQIQTLGPGGSPSSAVASQIGEFKLEGNFEYRVSLIKYFGVAWFIDAGNIWLWNNATNSAIPLATLQFSGNNPFWSEIAVGTGIGFRFDFNYFVFRLDLGSPLKDPALPADHRWIPNESIRRTILNIGIGYPF